MPVAAVAALIPIKAFTEGKSRLESALPAHERVALAEKLASAVVQACRPVPVFVACEDDEIESWAAAQGARSIRCTEPGLNRVVRHGVAILAREGYERVLVAHADLADPRNLPKLVDWQGVVLVPDRRLDGTNAIVVPTKAGFTFSYGPGSFARHLSEAERLDVGVNVIDDQGLALDLDDPDDLAAYAAIATNGRPPTPRLR